MLQGNVEQARRLRQDMSLPEVILWRVLRSRPGGFKFRKGHPAQQYTADFYCQEARLIVEVDGQAHERGDRPGRDARRDRWFEKRGIGVLRITVVDVLKNLEGVVQGILARAGGESRRPPRDRTRKGEA